MFPPHSRLPPQVSRHTAAAARGLRQSAARPCTHGSMIQRFDAGPDLHGAELTQQSPWFSHSAQSSRGDGVSQPWAAVLKVTRSDNSLLLFLLLSSSGAGANASRYQRHTTPQLNIPVASTSGNRARPSCFVFFVSLNCCLFSQNSPGRQLPHQESVPTRSAYFTASLREMKAGEVRGCDITQ